MRFATLLVVLAVSSSSIARAQTACAANFADVQMAQGSAQPVYPPTLKANGVRGITVAAFVVGLDGTADTTSFKVVESTDALFTAAVRAALGGMRFTPACVSRQTVRQLVQLPFVFDVASSTPPDSAARATRRAAMVLSLRNTAVAQEAFFADNVRYANSVQELAPAYAAAGRSVSPGVLVVVMTASRTGWSGMAIDREFGGVTCTVVYGGSATTDGRPMCR